MLVTGGTGFLGKNISMRLKDLGADFLSINRPIYGGCEEPKFKKWLGGQDFDVIYHLGSTTTFQYDRPDAENTVLGIENIIKYAKSHNTHVVFPSTAAIYGDSGVFTGGRPFIETDLTHPLNLYHAIKVVAEGLLNYHLEKATIFRISNCYGDYENLDGHSISLVTQLCSSALNGNTVKIYDGGQPVRDYVYVSDVVGAMIEAVEKQVVGTFNLGSGTTINSVDLADIVSSITGRRIQLQLTKERRFRHAMETRIDISKLQKWHPNQTTPIERGIQRTINYLMRECKA